MPPNLELPTGQVQGRSQEAMNTPRGFSATLFPSKPDHRQARDPRGRTRRLL